MNKFIFEGTINGQTYNNMKEYNDTILDLIAKGENIEAMTHTTTVKETTSTTTDKLEPKYPGFTLDGEWNDTDFIDYYVEHPHLFESWLNENYTNAENGEYDNLCGCKVKEILNKLYEYDKKNDNQLATKLEELDKLEKFISKLESAGEVIRGYHDVYFTIKENKDDKELELDKCLCDIKCERKCKNSCCDHKCDYECEYSCCDCECNEEKKEKELYNKIFRDLKECLKDWRIF